MFLDDWLFPNQNTIFSTPNTYDRAKSTQDWRNEMKAKGQVGEISFDDMQTYLRFTGGTNMMAPLESLGHNAWVEDGSIKYNTGWNNSTQISSILNYLKARNQGKQAQEEYVKLLKERPGRQGTILTAGSDPTIAQTIKTVLGTPNPQKTILGA